MGAYIITGLTEVDRAFVSVDCKLYPLHFQDVLLVLIASLDTSQGPTGHVEG